MAVCFAGSKLVETVGTGKSVEGAWLVEKVRGSALACVGAGGDKECSIFKHWGLALLTRGFCMVELVLGLLLVLYLKWVTGYSFSVVGTLWFRGRVISLSSVSSFSRTSKREPPSLLPFRKRLKFFV